VVYQRGVYVRGKFFSLRVLQHGTPTTYDAVRDDAVCNEVKVLPNLLLDAASVTPTASFTDRLASGSALPNPVSLDRPDPNQVTHPDPAHLNQSDPQSFSPPLTPDSPTRYTANPLGSPERLPTHPIVKNSTAQPPDHPPIQPPANLSLATGAIKCRDREVSTPCLRPLRLGISISRKVSKHAVVRNRLKRQLRAIWRHFLPHLKPNVDVVIIVHPSACEGEWDQFNREIEKLLKRSALLQQPDTPGNLTTALNPPKAGSPQADPDQK